LSVVSLVGTWIETDTALGGLYVDKSCPSWARGLKH